jgi:hypothetical protein
VNALLDMVLAGYSIDKKKVVVTGFSMRVPAPGILRKNSQNVSARRFQSPAGRRHPPPGGGFRFWQFTPTTTRSYLLVQRRRELRNFRKQGVNAKLIPPTGITHYETYRFRDALRQVIPWLQEVWLHPSPLSFIIVPSMK